MAENKRYRRWTAIDDDIIRRENPREAARQLQRPIEHVYRRRKTLGVADPANNPARKRPLNDLRTKRYHRLVVKHFAGIYSHAAYWCCVCDCGSVVKVRGSKLISGRQKSCGCHRADPAIRREARLKVAPEVRRAIASKGARARAHRQEPKIRYTLTARQAAEALNISEERILQLIDSGAVASKLTAHTLFVSRQDVEALAECCSIPLLRATRCNATEEEEAEISAPE